MDAWETVIADMAARRLTGIGRYRKPVRPADAGEDWLQHAYEEALDLCVYLKALIIRLRLPSPTDPEPCP